MYCSVFAKPRRLIVAVLLLCLAAAASSPAAADGLAAEAGWDRGANLAGAVKHFAELQYERGASGVAEAVRDCYAAVDHVRAFTAEVEYCIALDLGLTYWWEGYQYFTEQRFGRKSPMPEFSAGETVLARVLERLDQTGLTPDQAWEKSLEIGAAVKIGVYHAILQRSQGR